jgi:hypothetical protein
MEGKQVGTGTPRRLQDERLRVRHWRHSQLFELGFTSSDARTLARSPADLAQIRELVASGCPPATAFRIVR